MVSNDDGPNPGIQIVLGSRQLAAVLFMAMVILGLLTTIAYLTGRMVTPVRADSPKRHGKQVIVAETPGTQKTPCQQGSHSPKPADEAPASQRYFQVVATDRPGADATAKSLATRGLPSMVIPGPTESVFRVLVGPMTDTSQADRIKATLDEAGFRQSFPRLY